MKVETQEVEIKNQNKPFFPRQDVTKGDLIDYYGKIADYMLPYLKNRPLTLSRFPDGIDEEGFYQKEVPDYFPEWIKTTEVEKREGGSIRQVVCNDKPTLVYLVNQGTTSFHPWLSTTSGLNKPDRLVFDLDPPQGNFDLVIKGAKTLRRCLEEELGLSAFVLATGSEGMHVITPIKPDKTFKEVRQFAKKIADFVTRDQPDSFTTEVRKNKRNDRLYIDYMRNAYGQTSIAPYSIRALEGAPVATPLEWDELNKNDLSSDSYHIKNIFRRLSQREDPWNQFHNQAKDIDESRRRLNDKF